MPVMPNIATALKDEITRLARKELRSGTASLQKATSRYRSEISNLKRRVEQLERELKRVSKATPRATSNESVEPNEADGQYRWRATGFAQHRKRLGLSAAECAKLLGVSALSVYKWESGQTRPRAAHLPAIAQLRAMGKREATQRLQQLV